MNHTALCAMEMRKNIECQMALGIFTLCGKATVKFKVMIAKVNSSYMNAYSFPFSFFI